ncbi:MAG TPA: hypothetical protein PKJ63_00370 [Cyclobacteriaceae bacterium]|nr:hypothetical protein [Cyclobacteriaceae bacterium]
MKHDSKNPPFSRRKFLGISLALPFLPVTKPMAAVEEQKQDDEFVTMLTAEGKAVKVRKDALKEAKVVENKMSNQSLLNWLKPKGLTK